MFLQARRSRFPCREGVVRESANFRVSRERAAPRLLRGFSWRSRILPYRVSFEPGRLSSGVSLGGTLLFATGLDKRIAQGTDDIRRDHRSGPKAAGCDIASQTVKVNGSDG